MEHPPPLIRPTPGAVRTGFRYDRAMPFAAGQRRTTMLAARPGERVAAPCRGRVTFAGRTPRGPAIAVRCGPWTATVVGVAGTVRAGTSVAAGRAVGRASGSAVGLSLRPVADRWGYVDPRPAFATPRTGTPLGPAPRPGRAPRSRPAPRRDPRPRPAPRWRPRPAGADRPLPAAAPAGPVAEVAGPQPSGRVRADPRVVGVGLALAALGLPALGHRRRSRRRSRAHASRSIPSVDR